ncbi:MAG: TIGR00296 family protein, partial [Thermoplasmata archaeon]
LPVYPLDRAISLAAHAAAREDPRFPSVTVRELPRIVVELSILTVPVPLRGRSPEARRAEVRVGIDGLILEAGGRSGLLLPQVAPEQGWDAEELLRGTSEKAGLAPSAWERPETRIRSFRAEIFRERSPGGAVVRGA